MNHLNPTPLAGVHEAARAPIAMRYRHWQQLLRTILTKAEQQQDAMRITTADPLYVVTAVHFSRLVSTVLAVETLLERGYVAQARTLLRMALESGFVLRALANEPEFAHEITQSQEAERRTLADRALHWHDAALKEQVAAQISELDLRRFISERSTAREVKTYDIAVKAEMIDTYKGMYALLSLPTHGAISDLDSLVVHDSAGDIVAIKRDPQIENQDSTWAFAAEILVNAIDAFLETFSLPFPERQSIVGEISALVATSPDA